MDDFDARYHSELRRILAARSTKTFLYFRTDAKNDEEAFRKLVVEIEILLCLDHDEYQSNYVLYSASWSTVDGCPWSIYAL